LDAFAHAEIVRNAGFTLGHRLAWIEMNPEARIIDMIIENMLADRNICLARLFSDETEAKRWLLGDDAA
jgi:hypothetical protein